MANLPRIRTATCLALLALGTASAGAQEPGAPAPPSAAGRATADLVDCHVAVDQSARYVTFAGQMSTLPGADRLAMRMDLQERDPGTAFRDVSAPNLGVWRRSAPGVAALRYFKQVTNLPAPAAFRAVISFRWLDAAGHVVRRAARRSPLCLQPDERPRLSVVAVDVAPGTSTSTADYRVTLRNDGRGAAGAFGVVLTVGGQDQPPLTVAGLEPARTTVVEQVAPRCAAGSTLTVTPDPQHQLDEAAGGGQPRSVPCPPAAQAQAGSAGQ
jgi:hypothetical protein